MIKRSVWFRCDGLWSRCEWYWHFYHTTFILIHSLVLSIFFLVFFWHGFSLNSVLFRRFHFQSKINTVQDSNDNSSAWFDYVEISLTNRLCCNPIWKRKLDFGPNGKEWTRHETIEIKYLLALVCRSIPPSTWNRVDSTATITTSRGCSEAE